MRAAVERVSFLVAYAEFAPTGPHPKTTMSLLVVGCDGAHSPLRNMVFTGVPAEDFTGLAVWRASMPRPPQVDCMQVFYAPRSKGGVNPHSREEMFLFLVEQAPKGRRIPPEAVVAARSWTTSASM